MTAPKKEKLTLEKASWQSPSNIALVKYWGKRESQIPINPSISMTLSRASTTTEISITKKENQKDVIEFDFFLDGKTKNDFKPKLAQFFNRIKKHFPWLKEYRLTIHSSNTFPHSTGIASSASAMSAMALCLCSLDPEISKQEDSVFMSKASEISRLGSGSASRSVFPSFALWGRTDLVDNSTDKIAIPLENVHSSFLNLKDAIIIVDDSEKKVSSTAGHELMKHHDFKDVRIEQANKNIRKLLKALSDGSWSDFISIVEHEALTLHALMMSSDPSYVLLNGESIKIIHAIQSFRERTGLNCCFTIDAGPNIHVLYDGAKKIELEQFINEELVRYCDIKSVLYDGIGIGPKRIA